MVSNEVRSFLLFAFVLFLFPCSAVQSQNKDFGLWTSVNFEVKIVKKVNITISEELRLNENITELGTIFTDIGLEYKLNKHFQFSANYRFYQKRTMYDYYSIRHRVYADIKYSKKLKSFQILFRTRFQVSFRDINRDFEGGIKEYYLRNKLSLQKEINKSFKPYVSIELFSSLNYPRTNAFDNMRVAAGVDYSLSKRNKIDVYYMIQKQFNVSISTTDFVLGIAYLFKL